jgi:hypothetical protein
VRQIVTIRFLRPLAKALGIKGAKIMRFTERELVDWSACADGWQRDMPSFTFRSRPLPVS